MFDQTVDQPYRRRSLSKKGLAKMLLFYVAICIAFILWFHHLANRDAQIAGRERIVIGAITKINKGKNESASYDFRFEGVRYQGNDDCDYLDLSVGEGAKVFVDPQHPESNGLRSFGFKRNLHHGFMILLIYASVGLAIISAILWLRVIAEGSSQDKQETT